MRETKWAAINPFLSPWLKERERVRLDGPRKAIVREKSNKPHKLGEMLLHDSFHSERFILSSVKYPPSCPEEIDKGFLFETVLIDRGRDHAEFEEILVWNFRSEQEVIFWHSELFKNIDLHIDGRLLERQDHNFRLSS